MADIIFVTGGARSGKSSYAITEAETIGRKPVYIATAEPLDDEMKDRIDIHRKERGSHWTTIEEAIDLEGALSELNSRYDVAVIDCITLWLSNLLCSRNDGDKTDLYASVSGLLGRLKDTDIGMTLYIVSNEVGMGIVPENALAREFRDLAGKVNRMIADIADHVVLIVSGMPLKIK